ncbi:MFS transporter [Halorhodospira halochloris]|uniref:MFS transporter n=1 Tax=Halorhodospira halochloris TaxID=1052 RepID=UPI001EE93886|nr:MFS transporter [Halorhodospira halochloris]MCG5530377.1 MFS transporter [Halorhodospira halochloris]
MSTSPAAVPVHNRTAIFAYAMLGLPPAICLPAFYLYLVPPLIDTPQVSILFVGIIIAILRIVDTVTPLFFGYWSDRNSIPAGRRKLGWFCGATLMIIGLAVPLLIDDQWGKAQLLVSGCALTFGLSIMRVSQLAWPAELSGYYHQRSRFYFAGQTTLTIGLIVGLALPFLATQSGVLTQGVDQAIFWSIVLLSLVASLMMLIYLPDPGSAPAPERFMQSFRRIRVSPSWRRLLIAHSLNIFANSLPVILVFHISMEVVGTSNIILPVVFTYLAAALVGLPIGLALARRCGKHQSWSAALIYTAAVLIWIPLLAEGDTLVMLILTALIGFTAGMDWALSAAIQADTVDSESLRNDTARAGFQFGLWLFAGRCALAVAILFAVGVLAITGGSAAITPGADKASNELILITAGLGSAFAKLIAVTQIWNLPLDATKHKEIQEKLRERRQGAAE